MEYKKCIVPSKKEKKIEVTLIFHQRKTFFEVDNIIIYSRQKADKLVFETYFCPAIGNAQKNHGYTDF